MNKNTWGVLIAIILIIGLVYVAKHHSAAPNNNPPAATTTVVNYFCEQGSIVASYTDSSVALSLSDGRNITLPQTMSGSGIRYESGTNVFVSKGSNAYLIEGSATTYANCVSGTQATNGGANTFTDATMLFSFVYPNSMTLSSGEQGYTQSWSQQSSALGLVLATATLPRSFMPQTNFSEAKFTVGTSSDPEAVAGCLTATNGGTLSGKVTIHGTEFTKVTMSDAGAGNFYDTTSYRTLKNGQCYAVEYTIHSINIGNYDPSQGIKEYDKNAVKTILEGVVQSFKFL